MLNRIFTLAVMVGMVVTAVWTANHPGSHAIDAFVNYAHMARHAVFAMTVVGLLVGLAARLRSRG